MKNTPPGWRSVGVAVAGALFGSGCVELDFASLSDPKIVEAVVLDVTMAEGLHAHDDIADVLGTWVTVQLVDADGTAAEGEAMPINNATVTLTDHRDQDIQAMPMGNGMFELGPDQGVAYVDGADWTLEVAFEDDTPGVLSMRLPPAAPVVVPTEQPVGLPMTVPINAPGYQVGAVSVYELATSELTHWDVPDSYAELYDAVHGGSDLTELQIAGTAFPRPGPYIVGVGVLSTDADLHLQDLNTTLSGGLAGRMELHAVLVN